MGGHLFQTSRMLVIALGLAFVAGCVAGNDPSQNNPTASRSPSLLREGVEIIRSHAMGGSAVDWKRAETELTNEHGDGPAALAAAVALLHDPHAKYTPVMNKMGQSAALQGTASQSASQQAQAKSTPEIPRVPIGQVHSDGVAYLVVPGCMASGADGLREYAKAAADELVRLNSDSPKAWLIDLRLNGGGNLWPMLLGLRPLLADGTLMTMVQGDRVESRFGLSERSAWIDWGTGPEAQLVWGETSAPRTMPRYNGRIAVLLGPWTMSSGEALTICLLARGNVRTFGEPTAGLTTVTNQYVLSDGSMLTLPVSRMGDRDGHAIAGKIAPMEMVEFRDWPSAEDAPANAARAWLLQDP